MTFTRTHFEESIIIKMFTIPLLYFENIITTEKYKLQFKPKRISTRVSLVYTLLFSYNCMIAKVLSKIYHAMSYQNKPNLQQLKVSCTDKTHISLQQNIHLHWYIFFQKYIEFEIICNSPVNR